MERYLSLLCGGLLMAALTLASGCDRPAFLKRAKNAGAPDTPRGTLPRGMVYMGSDNAALPATVAALKRVLPQTAGGIPLLGIESETNTAPGAAVAIIKATYENDSGTRIEIALSDMGAGRDDLASTPGFDWLTAQIEKETESGFERSFSEPGCKGYEKYDVDSHYGQIKALMDDRYLTEIFGYGVDRPVLRQVLAQIKITAAAGKNNSAR